MAKRVWELKVEGELHKIEIDHGYWTGRRKIWIDSNLVFNERKVFDYGSHHKIDVGGKEFSLSIITNGFTYDYFLFDGETLIEYLNNNSKPSKMIANAQNAIAFWNGLENRTGLRLKTSSSESIQPSWRLAGRMKGYLLVIQQVAAGRITIGIRGRESQDIYCLENKLRKDPDFQELLSKIPFMQVDGSNVLFGLQIPIKGEAVEMAVRQINDMLTVLSKYLRPTLNGVCEGVKCPQRPGTADTRIVLVNGMPFELCNSCAQDVDRIIEMRKTQSASPTTIIKAALMGLIGALVAAVLWS